MNLPWLQKPIWLVVEPTPLKHININPNGNLPQIGVKEQNIWNHHLARYNTVHAFYICLQSKERIFWGALSKNKFWKRIFLVERMQTVRHPFRITWNKETSNSHFLGWNPQNNDTKLYFLLVPSLIFCRAIPMIWQKKRQVTPPSEFPGSPTKSQLWCNAALVCAKLSNSAWWSPVSNELVAGGFNQPIRKNMMVKMGSSPQGSGWKF